MKKGIEVVINEKTYTLSKLTVGAVEKLTEAGHMAALDSPDEVKQFKAVVAFVSAVLSRNHPECTEDWVRGELDFDELRPLGIKCVEAGLGKQKEKEQDPTSSP